MSKPIPFLLSVIASVIIPLSSYANINDANLPNLPTKNLSIAQVNDWKSIPVIKDKLKAENQREVNLLIDLKSKINKLDFSNKENVLQKLTNMINENKKLNSNNEDNNRINFLELQLTDAYAMVKAVNISAMLTSQILSEMSALASQAANGTFSALQLEELNMQYQAYKSAMHFAQTIDLYNGSKKLSGGDIQIQFGDNADAHSRLVINLPAFDVAALSLEDSAINTLADAQTALITLNNASVIVTNVIVKSNLYLNDALIAILIEPSILSQQLYLFNQAQALAMNAIGGPITISQLANLDSAFTYIKATMTQTQTYVSLDGVKKLGYGNIHIQIGKYTTPETVLNIQIPVTDVEVLGLDKLDMKSIQSASAALSAINADTQKFIYG